MTANRFRTTGGYASGSRKYTRPIAQRRGARSPFLSEDDVRTIRLLHAQGAPLAAIAAQFGCHTSTVSSIGHRRSRAGVPD